MRIRDPIHGTIQLTPLEERLMDCGEMQRLRNIRQLAMAYLVYPGANHTRFEHSVGTLFLADRICRELKLPEKRAAPVRAAALLHDIGHVAFSHESESVLCDYLGSHEKVGAKMIGKGRIAEMLSHGGMDPKGIAKLHETSLGQIIASDIGADRMDYLLRDSHYTGVAYGVVDSDRICSSVFLSKKGMVLDSRGLEAAESLLVARSTMFSTVYLHKTVRIASRMLQEAIRLAISDGTLLPEDSVCMGDSTMLARLEESEGASEFAKKISGRRLYKRAHGFDPDGITKESVGEMERELSVKCRCPVLIDVPKIPSETSVLLCSGEKCVPLARASELVSSLQKMQKKRLEAIVMCEERHVKRVADAARKLLG
jgi:putative nucleotidyltransferase with HDIG domain